VSFQIITNLWFWAVAIPAVTLTGISKGGMGGGAAGIATPLLAMVISPVQAAAIMLPILCMMDLAGLQVYLGRWDRRIMRVILPAGLLGCVVGTLTFSYLNDNWIRLLLGIMALGFLAYNLLPRAVPLRKPSDRQGYFWSMLSGFTSFVSHSGGPPLMVYLLPQKLDKAMFVATSVVFFGAMNYAKIVPYLWLGLFDARNLASSLLLIPIGVAGTYLGVWLQTRINARWFYRLVYALLFLTGIKLLYDGVTGL
jgi:uncharacterized membrane protein YfcA